MVLIAAGLGESLFALVQYLTHYDRVWAVFKPAGYALRGSGTYVNPNNFAGFRKWCCRWRWLTRCWAVSSATVKVLLGYCALVMMAGVVVSQSRGGPGGNGVDAGGLLRGFVVSGRLLEARGAGLGGPGRGRAGSDAAVQRGGKSDWGQPYRRATGGSSIGRRQRRCFSSISGGAPGREVSGICTR